MPFRTLATGTGVEGFLNFRGRKQSNGGREGERVAGAGSEREQQCKLETRERKARRGKITTSGGMILPALACYCVLEFEACSMASIDFCVSLSVEAMLKITIMLSKTTRTHSSERVKNITVVMKNNTLAIA